LVRVETQSAFAASGESLILANGKDVSASRTNDENRHALSPIGVPGEDVPREEVNVGAALRARENFHPEVVQHVATIAPAISALVEPLDLGRHRSLKPPKALSDAFPVSRPQRGTNRAISHGIDVAANGRTAKLVSLSNGRTTTHEWVEHDKAVQGNWLPEIIEYGRALWHGRCDDRGAKD